jgi:hypothetical protein
MQHTLLFQSDEFRVMFVFTEVMELMRPLKYSALLEGNTWADSQ